MQKINNLEKRNLTLKNLKTLKNYWILHRKRVELVNEGIAWDRLDLVSREIYLKWKEEGYPCGTSCSLIGLAPEVLSVDLDKHFIANSKFSYDKFGQDHFPFLYNKNGITNDLWEYIFSEIWGNDLDEALERIGDVLDGSVNIIRARILVQNRIKYN